MQYHDKHEQSLADHFREHKAEPRTDCRYCEREVLARLADVRELAEVK